MMRMLIWRQAARFRANGLFDEIEIPPSSRASGHTDRPTGLGV
jgi:hypothetical protein